MGTGNVSGPPSTTAGDLALWNNTNGTLIKDGGRDLSTFLATPTGGTQASVAALLSGNAPLSGQHIYADPFILSCPAANCPHPQDGSENQVLTSALLEGATAKDSTYDEWLGVDSLYVNTGQPNGQKVARYIGVVQGPLGGTTWALNTDTVRNGIPNGISGPGNVGSSSPGTPGAIPNVNGTIGYELDYTNWDKDCPPGTCFTVGLYLHNQSTFPSLAAIYMDSDPENNNNFAWHDGVFINNTYTVKDNAFIESTGAAYGFQANGTGHVADFYANGAGQYGLQLNGTHTTAEAFFSGSAPSALLLQGSHSIADINDTASGPSGLHIAGAHTYAAIDTILDTTTNALLVNSGQKICLNMTHNCLYYSSGKTYLTDNTGQTILSIADGTGAGIIRGGWTTGTP
jgi:hypothetical protein